MLKHADASGLQECLDYVLFPFGIILDALISNHRKDVFQALNKDSSICDTLTCLETLVSKSHLDEGQVVSLTQRLASMLALPKERLSEEPRKMVSCILGKVYEKECERMSGKSWLAQDAYKPLIGSVISILLSHPYNDPTNASNIIVDVQKASLEALRVFVRTVGSAASLAFFVPGVVTGLVKRIMVQIDENVASEIVTSKNSTGVIASLKVMQELFIQVFSDDVVQPFVDEVPAQHCPTSTSDMYHSMLRQMAQEKPREKAKIEDSVDVLKRLEANINTDKNALHVELSWNWIQATAIRVMTFLQIIVPKLCCHNNAAVRMQVAEFGSCILHRCAIAFNDTSLIFEALLLLGQDAWPSVKSIAGSCLSLYFEEHDWQRLINVSDSMACLANKFKENERKGREEALRLASAIEYSQCTAGNPAMHLLISAESRDRLLDYLSACIDIDVHSSLIVARGPCLAIMDIDSQGSKSQTYVGRSSMPDCLTNIVSRNGYAAFATLIHQIVRASLSHDVCTGKCMGSSYIGLIASALRNFGEIAQAPTRVGGSPWQIELSKIVLVLTEILDGSILVLESEESVSVQESMVACCKNAILDILYTFQEQHIWLLRTTFTIHTQKVDDQDTLNSILQHYCLNCIGVAARCLKSEFSADGTCMHVAMLPVIEKFASSYQYVSASAKATIQSICSFCGYEHGLDEMIQKNIDYVVDGMCLRLRQPSVYPEAPKLFAALLKQKGVAVALMPLLSEPADHAIKGISIIHRREKPENVLSFVLCTLEIAQGAYQVATSACGEMEALAQKILPAHIEADAGSGNTTEDPENPSIEEIADYFDAKRSESIQTTGTRKINVSLDVWESVMLCRRRLSSAASLSQSISDSVGPLSVSKSLPVAVQSFKTAVRALHALNKAHTGLEMYKKQLEESIQCKGQTPVIEKNAPPTFLPSIHLLWTPLMGSLNDWRTPVLEEAIGCLGDILLLAPAFLARRFTKEAWPRLQKILEQGAPRRNLIVPGHDDTSSPALDAKMQRAVLNMIIHLTSRLGQQESADLLLSISRDILRDILVISRRLQATKQSSMHDISDTLRDCYAAMASVNPDAAWMILYNNGGISPDIVIDIDDVNPDKASTILDSLPELPLPKSSRSPWDDSVMQHFHSLRVM